MKRRRRGACGGCAAGAGRGSGALERLWGSRRIDVVVGSGGFGRGLGGGGGGVGAGGRGVRRLRVVASVRGRGLDGGCDCCPAADAVGLGIAEMELR